eukprot:GHVU01132093.1.p2 GENE.GHVU01132093.1~~GHVU01132093.1.p2  ORF type:complete len:247 (-),score=31.12 GHVU01132093.1:1364-2104(-)
MSHLRIAGSCTPPRMPLAEGDAVTEAATALELPQAATVVAAEVPSLTAASASTNTGDRAATDDEVGERGDDEVGDGEDDEASAAHHLPVADDVDSSDCAQSDVDETSALDRALDAAEDEECVTSAVPASARSRPVADASDDPSETLKYYQCTCPDYWHARVCYHVVLHQSLRGCRNLAQELALLPFRKKSGRPSKRRPALERQNSTEDLTGAQPSRARKRGSRYRGTGRSSSSRALPHTSDDHRIE